MSAKETETKKKPAAKKADDKAPAKKVAAKKEAKAEAPAKAEKPKAEEKAAKPAKAEKPAKASKEKKEKSKLKAAGVSDASLYDVIVRPIVTEKSTMLLEHNTYLFMVSGDSTKPRIKQAVEEVFGVSVLRVNTLNLKGKTKRFRNIAGRRSDIKKAMVTLKQGQSIDFAAGVR